MRSLKFVLGGLFLACAIFAAWYLAPKPSSDIFTLQGHGLRGVYFVPTDDKQTYLRLVVQAGEYDNQGTEGIAHYVEHLAWLNAVGANKALIDRHTNAFTSPYSTDYVLMIPAEKTAEALDTMAKIFDPWSLDQDFMLSERRIILREFDYRQTDNPIHDYVNKINEIGYLNDPLARSVIGTRADIATFDLGEAREWHVNTHRPEGAILLISSPLPKDHIAQMVSAAFPDRGTFQPAAPISFRMGPVETITRHFTDDRFGAGMVNLQKIVEIQPPLPLAAQNAQLGLLYDILDSTLPGSYARPLRFGAQIAQSYDLQIFSLSDRHYELSILAARPDAGVSLAQLQQGLVQAIDDATITAETFERVKDRWLKRIEAEESDDLALDMAGASAARRENLVTPGAYLDAARAITLDDMNRFARGFAGPGRMIIDVVSPQ